MEVLMLKKNRREFVKTLGVTSAALGFYPNFLSANQETSNKMPFITMVTNGTPEEMVEKSLQPLGGMEAFVKKGQTVVLKPNMSWDRRPEQGANTHPDVVATVVRVALKAGAKQVRVFDRTCNEKRRSYKRSGIEAAEVKQEQKFIMSMNENLK
jgi:uncharacterized protein (DUF362 family)